MERFGKLATVGLFTAIMIVLTVAAYFLYPYIQAERYGEIVSEYRAVDPADEVDSEILELEFDEISEQLLEIREEREELLAVIDSLESANRNLLDELETLRAGSVSEPGGTFLVAHGNEHAEAPAEEAFADRVKSLLNLDEEELAPIVNQMSNLQLTRLYRGGGTIQREKLLRSLSPDRAAELMSEVML